MSNSNSGGDILSRLIIGSRAEIERECSLCTKSSARRPTVGVGFDDLLLMLCKQFSGRLSLASHVASSSHVICVYNVHKMRSLPTTVSHHIASTTMTPETIILGILAFPTAFWLVMYLIPQIYMVIRPIQDLKKKYNAEWALVTGSVSSLLCLFFALCIGCI